MTNPAEPPFPPVVGRRLSAHELDRMIRRAAELQAAIGEGAGGTITEAEALRIGRGLGLSMDCLQRALSETSHATAATGVVARLFAPEIVRAARPVRGAPATIARTVERYLLEREHLVVLRRLGDRVVFTRATGVPAALKRAVSRAMRRSPLLHVTTLDVAVHALDEDTSYITLTTSLRSQRTTTTLGTAIGAGAGASAAAALLVAGAPEVALLVAPTFAAGAGAASRAQQRKASRRVQVQLESLLDRVEHDELPAPLLSRMRPRWRVAGPNPGVSTSE